VEWSRGLGKELACLTFYLEPSSILGRMVAGGDIIKLVL
jgi:hypothetical protein